MKNAKEWIKRKLGCSKAEDLRPSTVSDDWFMTFAQSVDRNDPPPAELIELTCQLARAALYQVSLDDIAKLPFVDDFYRIWPGDNYRLLAAIMVVLQPKVVVEIGTWTGLSALSMKKYLPADGRIISFDIQPWKEVHETVLRDEDFSDNRLEQRLADLSDPASFEAHRAFLQTVDFFFIDGPKNGEMEYRLLDHLRTLKFARAPIIVFDDIHLPNMLKLWRELRVPKLDITTFGHWSGTGLVKWTV
jgi:hypothetical protein